MAVSVPNFYGALDDAVFADGRAVDAFTLRAMANAANRLMGAKSQMFAWAKPTRVTTSTPDYTTYEVPVDADWSPVVPPFYVRKKPGTTRADFYVRCRATATTRLQIVTRGRPLQVSPVDGTAGVFTVTGGTSFGSVYVPPIPIDDGIDERISIWASAAVSGTTATSFLGGSSASGELRGVVGSGDGQLLLRGTGGAALNYAVTGTSGGDFGRAGYSIDLFTPQGNRAARLRILGIVPYWADSTQRLVFTPLNREQIRSLNGRSSFGGWTYTITEGSIVSIQSFAGATEVRTS